MEDLKDWLERNWDEHFRKLGLRPMTDEEWEKYKAKQQQGPVTGTITFLKGESAKKAAALFKKKEE
jgi:hypothetical protein